MERDLTLFPQDITGDRLWEMLTEGDDLNDTREVEFSMIFAEEQQALLFGKILLENNQKLSFCPYQGDKDFPWEITAYPEMTANYENIEGYRQLLESNAEQHNGKFDGWYCVTAAKLPY